MLLSERVHGGQLNQACFLSASMQFSLKLGSLFDHLKFESVRVIGLAEL